MASINYAAREINVKIVYYGPGLSGKTTNLQVIHRKVPPEFKSDMVSLATETDRTLFFDFLPLDLGKIKGFSTKFQLYTVPGQVYYNATRKLVLRGVDGIVFVADSAQDKIDENIESFQNLEDNLAEYGYKRENIPTIVQYNKRDLPNALSIEEMHQHINKYNLPWSEAVANKGIGVFDSLKLIGKIVIDYLNKKYSRGGTGGQRPSGGSPQRTRPQPQPQAPEYTGGMQQQYNPSPRMQQQPSMFNQLGQQQPVIPAGQQFQAAPPMQPQLRPMYTPQQPRQPITPPAQFSPGRGPGLRPQQQPSQSPQQAFQAPSTGYQSFEPPTPQRPPQQPPPQQLGSLPVRQAAMQSQDANDFNEDISFEPAAMPPPSSPQQAPSLNTPPQDDYYNYGSISLDNNMDQNPQEMTQQPQQYDQMFQPAPDRGSNFPSSGKTDLDLEIERYQQEIEEKQRRSRGGGSGSPAPQQSFNQPNTQQQPQSFGQTSADYDVYNMELPTYNPQQPPRQQAGGQVLDMGGDDEEMFFTSVDKDRQKKPVKRPMNPRTSASQQQDKGFLSKFFKKDMP